MKPVKPHHFLVVGENNDDKKDLACEVTNQLNIAHNTWEPAPINFDAENVFQQLSEMSKDHYILLRFYEVPNNFSVREIIFWNGYRTNAKKFAKRVPSVEKVSGFFEEQRKKQLKEQYNQLQQQMRQIEGELGLNGENNENI